MKKPLFFLFVLLVTFSITHAQTITFIGTESTSWSNPLNWDLGSVPTVQNDVIIPTGKTVSAGVISIKSIQTQGNVTFEMGGNITFTNASSFSSNTVTNWQTGALTGGGTLVNAGTINMTTDNDKAITGATTLTNSGTINFTTSADMQMSNSTINNSPSGVINIASDGVDFTFFFGQGTINNSGTFKKLGSPGQCTIGVILINSGTISVESGTLLVSNADSAFNGGIYNVSTDCNLRWGQTITTTGMLTGLLNGEISWEGNISVPVGQTATFNFSGPTPINWTSGGLRGGGTLVNPFQINLNGAGDSAITQATTLNNSGTFRITSSGDCAMSASTFNNLPTGILEMKGDAGNFTFFSGQGTINNTGLIKRFGSTGSCTIGVILLNSGTVSVESGTLLISNADSVFTGGIYNVAAASKLRWGQTITMSGTLTGLLNGEITWEGNVTVPIGQTATFNFSGPTPINWSNGSLRGGGTLVNPFQINLIGASDSTITQATTLNNSGTFRITSSGDCAMSASTFNNLSSGVIIMQGDAGNFTFFSGAGILNNTGTIRRTTATGSCTIGVILNNTGTINTETGTLIISNDSTTLTNGIYNVTAGANLTWNQVVTGTGVLTGLLNGPINWNSNLVIAPAQSATFNFTGPSSVNWNSGSLTGGGTLINKSTITRPTATNVSISGSTFNNEGLFSVPVATNLNLSSATFSNMATGVMDFSADGASMGFASSAFHILNNNGLLKKSAGSGSISLGATVNNSGVLDVQSGTISLSELNNTTTGIVKGIGTLNLPSAANYTNNGIFAPGGSPGTLTLIGNQKSAPSSTLEVELNGTIQGSQYDLLAIQGAAAMDGEVAIILGFAPAVGNSFTIVTTSGLISTQTLGDNITAIFNGNLYTFAVTYPDNNKVVLTVTQVTLSTDENEFLARNVSLSPNPAIDVINLRNDSGFDLENAQMIDFHGRVVQTFSLTGMDRDLVIPLDRFASGVYLLKIDSENGNTVKRFLKR